MNNLFMGQVFALRFDFRSNRVNSTFGYTKWPTPKIQQTKMLVTCQRFGDWFLFGLVWQYSSIQKNIIKVGTKSWLLTCSCHITLSLPFYTDPDQKRELNFCNGYLSLLYFCTYRSLDLDLCFFFSKTTFLLVHFLSLCCIDDANFFTFVDDRHIKVNLVVGFDVLHVKSLCFVQLL